MSGAPRQSLTLLTAVPDAAACARLLEETASKVHAGWSSIAGIHTACLALLPPVAGAPSALFFECTFEGDLTSLGEALWRELGAALAAVFLYCEGRPRIDDAPGLSEFLRARARRTRCLPAHGPAAREAAPPFRTALQRCALALAARWSVGVAKREPASPLEPEALEARRAAVGWQESVPGVPLVHVAEVSQTARTRGRLKRALQAIEGAAPSDRSFARFLLGRERLVFFAYPKERAAPFSERLSRELTLPLARIWAQTRGAPHAGPLLRQRLRARRIERFLLGSRVPVAVWYNAG